jgi:hypothetical protein
MKTLLKVSSLALLASSAAFAGTAEVSAPSVSPASDPWLSASASLGYESSYYFRGLWFSNNNFFGGVNLSAPLTEKLTLGVGALYTQTAGATEVNANETLDYSEMDLFASLAYATDFATFTLSATHYQFIDTFSGSAGTSSTFPGAPYGTGAHGDLNVTDATDFGLGMVKSFGDFNYYLSAFYDVRINAPYFETAIDYTYAVNDKLKLVPSIQTGYAKDYYTGGLTNSDGEGFTHILAAITAPYAVCESLTITPYIANNHSLETRKIQNQADQSRSEVYGGISASYSF